MELQSYSGKGTKVKKIEFDKPRFNKLGLILSTIVVTVFLILVLLAIYGVISFFKNYGLQNPIVLRSPVYSKTKDILISPISTKSAKQSMVIDLSKIADKIFTLESSRGKNVNCPEGTYNGYGYRQNTFEWVCYPTQDEVRQHVINWLSTNIKGGDVETALCKYNRGISEKGCTYAVNYASL